MGPPSGARRKLILEKKLQHKLRKSIYVNHATLSTESCSLFRLYLPLIGFVIFTLSDLDSNRGVSSVCAQKVRDRVALFLSCLLSSFLPVTHGIMIPADRARMYPRVRQSRTLEVWTRLLISHFYLPCPLLIVKPQLP